MERELNPDSSASDSQPLNGGGGERFNNPYFPENPRGFKSPTEICRYLEEMFDFPRGTLLSPSRKSHYALVRHMAMYLMRDQLGLSYSQISRALRRQDHTTSIHGVERIKRGLLGGDEFIANRLAFIARDRNLILTLEGGNHES